MTMTQPVAATSTALTATLTAGPAAVPAPPRWAVRAAHVAAVTALPAGLWRLGLVAGWHGGYTDAGYQAMGLSGWGAVWPVFLSLFTEALALLTLGLVRPWGTVPPHWVPFVGGRPVNPRAVVLAASCGAAGLGLLWTPFAGWWAMPGTGMTPLGHFLVGFLYLPAVAWAPLLAAVTASYHRRHRAR
ncbi:hypothetical protein [Streptomyces sp. 1331.2]|uniref:hypothetical protein n=1 Tax=Streptomyces sp. 1331.2 TaxID=1938835 RepID=UPI000BC915D3|nr:hypothetical protein [Streptomyces sp. 1331.2]SOB83969.1 hypothetical protein SAMN06272789_4195 [Streptomyces sp. 1331.2]